MKKSSDIHFISLLVIIAFGLRLTLAFFPCCGMLFADMRDYDLLAQRLLEEGTFGPAVRPPLYPLFLAGVYRVSGHSLDAARFAQAVLGLLVCLFVYVIGVRLGGIRAGRLAGIIVALYPGLVIYTNLLMAENLFIFLLSLALLLLLHEGGRRNPSSFAAGIAIGLGCLTKTMLAGFAPLAALWLWRRREPRGALLLLLGSLLVVAPWSVRSGLRHGRFVLVDTFGGYNLHVGNNPEATGRQYIPPGGKRDGPASYADSRDAALVDAENRGKAMRYIAGHPGHFLRLGVTKLGYLFGLEIRELSWGYSLGYFGEVPRGLLVPAVILILVSFPLLCVLALEGLLLIEREKCGVRGGWALLVLVVLYFSAVYFVTFGESRFHLPLVPVLALAAARLVAPRKKGAGAATLPGMSGRALIFIILFVLLCLNWGEHFIQNRPRLRAVLAPGGHASKLPY